MFSTSAFLSFKGMACKVLWKKGISRRSKELTSDPGHRASWLGCHVEKLVNVTSSYIQFWL